MDGEHVKDLEVSCQAIPYSPEGSTKTTKILTAKPVIWLTFERSSV